MSDYLVQQIQHLPNVEVRFQTEIVDADGDQSLERITLRDRARDTEETVPAASVFALIGAEPHTEWLDGTTQRDAFGFLLTGRDVQLDGAHPAWPLARAPAQFETSMPGVFAAGDVRFGSIKRVGSAVGEGSVAVRFVHDYLAPQPMLAPQAGAARDAPRRAGRAGARRGAEPAASTRPEGAGRPPDGRPGAGPGAYAPHLDGLDADAASEAPAAPAGADQPATAT